MAELVAQSVEAMRVAVESVVGLRWRELGLVAASFPSLKLSLSLLRPLSCHVQQRLRSGGALGPDFFVSIFWV